MYVFARRSPALSSNARLLLVDAVNLHATQLSFKCLGLLLLELHCLAIAMHVEHLPGGFARFHKSANLFLCVLLAEGNSCIAVLDLLLGLRGALLELTSGEVLSDLAWENDPVLVAWVVVTVHVWHPILMDVEADSTWTVLAGHG